jgi:hypothetical protein
MEEAQVSTTLMNGMLGKLPVRKDPRTLSFARYVDRLALPKPPAKMNMGHLVHDWPMYGNDHLGDCTCAAAGHMIEAWTADSHGHAVEITEAAVETAFDNVKVTDPVTHEQGAYELDVLNYWRKTGFGTHKIGAFAEVPIHDHTMVRTAAWLFGGLYIGIALPITAQTQEVWDWTHSLSGAAAPGSWGGHAVNVMDYGPQDLTVVTWGQPKLMTWAFWDRYVDEVYCILSTDFLNAGVAPNGFDLHALQADLALLVGT